MTSILSIIEDQLHLGLDNSHENFIVTGFLNRLGFRKQNGIFVNRKIDATTIKRTRDFFNKRNFIFELAENCQNVLHNYETSQQNFQNTIQDALEIKNTIDDEFEDLSIP